MNQYATKDFEFYPTPLSLARKMWDKFQDKDFTRVLEPSAGTGNLIEAKPGFRHDYRDVHFDVCEIDMSMHPVLKEIKGVNVVGLDFMDLSDASAYSHILMNPPFSVGVKHVLKAWEIAFDCEIVALLNAQSIKNPSTKEGKFLCNLIDQHGSVEFIQDAFLGSDVQRETAVEVALIYLKKSLGLDDGFAQDLISNLESEDASHKAESMARDYKELRDLAIPTTEIENSVRCFNMAVNAMRDSVMAEAKATYFEVRIGQTMANRMAQKGENRRDTSAKWVASEIGTRYDKLKDRAWSSLLSSAKFTSKLSSKAERRFNSEFSSIKKLSFTVSNAYGFFRGILDNQWEIQLEMSCDIFDEITRYSSDNISFFKGWSSNSRHKTCGHRLKSTRFILPGNSAYFSGSISYEANRRLQDFDKVFALLGGKDRPDYGLADLFRERADDLKAGMRLDTSYFSVRWYAKQAGTIHFFPKNQAVMDRLNKLVGEHRKWLPPAGEKVSGSFWKQYELAEKFDKEVKRRFVEATRKGRYSYRDPLCSIMHDRDESESDHQILDGVLTEVLEKNGISVDFTLTHESADEPQLLLLAA